MAEKKSAENSGSDKGGKSTLPIVVLAILLAVAVGVAGYLLGARSVPVAAAAAAGQEPTGEGDGQGGASSSGLGPLVKLEDFIVNILDPQGTRYLKASMTLELAAPEAASEIELRRPQIRDAVLLLIGSKTFDEIRDLQGKQQLRAELVARINGLLKTGKVKTIYFTDFVVQ